MIIFRIEMDRDVLLPTTQAMTYLTQRRANPPKDLPKAICPVTWVMANQIILQWVCSKMQVFLWQS